MTLSAGTKLGPYEILAPIRAGGMGEVYRARDPRLGREVAIKVLPASFSQDPDRLKRFEQEARAAGVLNHPGITAVHDFGMHEGAPYIVTELLEGETLRNRLLSGPLPVRKALDYAVQIAKALAAAHEKGIVHRDLKPENLFLTRDGRVKILDFGLAKLKPESAESGQTDLKTVSGGTEPGVVLGTMGYMAPEQERGKSADARSDIFAFGTVLYEMLSGQRAFRGDSAADTITAILSKEPPDLSQTNKDVHPGIDRIVRHCLEKNPEERFQSSRDVAFDLESLSGVSAPTGAVPMASAAPRRRWVAPALIAAAVALAAGLAAGYGFGKKAGYVPPPNYQQLTFRRDGKRILLTASEREHGVRLYLLENSEAQPRALSPLGYRAPARCISPDGRFATVVGPDQKRYLYPLSGGEPSPIPGIEDAESTMGWTPDGKSLYVGRRGEYPARIFRLDLATGKRELWKELSPPDAAGISNVAPPAIADDGKTYAYSYNRILSDLFLAEGLK